MQAQVQQFMYKMLRETNMPYHVMHQECYRDSFKWGQTIENDHSKSYNRSPTSTTSTFESCIEKMVRYNSSTYPLRPYLATLFVTSLSVDRFSPRPLCG